MVAAGSEALLLVTAANFRAGFFEAVKTQHPA